MAIRGCWRGFGARAERVEVLRCRDWNRLLVGVERRGVEGCVWLVWRLVVGEVCVVGGGAAGDEEDDEGSIGVGDGYELEGCGWVWVVVLHGLVKYTVRALAGHDRRTNTWMALEGSLERERFAARIHGGRWPVRYMYNMGIVRARTSLSWPLPGRRERQKTQLRCLTSPSGLLHLHP